MKNNKGFSLVELIIVIAIMAILVGVLAPNLIKQLEKAKVSSDLEMCDAVVKALSTAEADVSAMASVNGPTALASACDADTISNTDDFGKAFWETMGCASGTIKDQLKSSGAKAGGVSCEQTTDGNYKAWIPGTDSTGKKGKNGTNIISVN